MSTRSPAQGTSRANFTLDRFELVNGERFEVEGRWSGVRGRRFLRPELTFTDRDGSHRLLADMRQKPWQAADDQAWAVAFPGGAPVDEAVHVELTVAPDLIVTLQRGRRRRARRPADSAPPAARQPLPTEPPKTAEDRGRLGAQLAEARQQLEMAQAELARLTARVDVVAQERDAVVQERDVARQERDEAHQRRAAAQQQREAAEAERDRLASVRNALVADQEGLAAARDAARDDATAAQRAAHDGARAAQRDAEQSREQLARVSHELRRTREALKSTAAERDNAIRVGKEIDRELQATRTERQMLLQERIAPALVPQSLPATPPGPPELRTEAWAAPARREPAYRTRAIVIAALVMVVLIMLVLLISR